MEAKGKIIVLKKTCNLIVTLRIHGPRPLRDCVLGWHRKSRKEKKIKGETVSPRVGKTGLNALSQPY